MLGEINFVRGFEEVQRMENIEIWKKEGSSERSSAFSSHSNVVRTLSTFIKSRLISNQVKPQLLIFRPLKKELRLFVLNPIILSPFEGCDAYESYMK